MNADGKSAKKKRTGKIEQFRLEGTITKMNIDDGLSGVEISEKLKEQGYSVSPATVCRWLKSQREAQAEDAGRIFSDHVAKELPKDLEALERMEALCLKWADEDGADRVQRIAGWAKVAQLVPEYARRLTDYHNRGEKERAGMVKDFITEIMGILMEDVKLVKQRLTAIEQARKIIETKLRNAGVIKSDEKGNIVIKAYDDTSDGGPGTAPGGHPGHPSPADSGRRFLSFQGGKD